MLTRRGSSLAELLVALTIAVVVLATAVGSLLRQQRTSNALGVMGKAATQLRVGTALLPAQLALASPAAGDLLSTQLRDSALQLRATVATGLACDSGTNPAFLDEDEELASGGIAAPPHAGDSLWWYLADSSRWVGRPVLNASSGSAPCPSARQTASRQVMKLRLQSTEIIPAGAPLRLTRQQRFVIYRSGDGTWQLGLREWSDATHSLASPQPVAGPFQRVASDGARSGFRYFDAQGSELHPELDSTAGSRVARIRFTALTVPALLTTDGPAHYARRDSVDVAFQSSGP